MMRPRRIEERKKIGREVLQGVQETTMKVSRSSSKACSRDLIIFSDYKKKALPCSLEEKKSMDLSTNPLVMEYRVFANPTLDML